MALSIASSSSFEGKIAYDTDLEADAKVNIFGGPVVVKFIDIDNAANAGTVVYVKLYDSSTTVTSGTTVPDHQIAVAGGARRALVYTGGVGFTSGLSMNCSTTAGTGGDATTDPSGAVIVSVVAT
jgi:hypothetical protein